jgi:hypothetical protein
MYFFCNILTQFYSCQVNFFYSDFVRLYTRFLSIQRRIWAWLTCLLEPIKDPAHTAVDGGDHSLPVKEHTHENFVSCSFTHFIWRAWECNINVWFRLMYSQKWNCRASLFPKFNYNFLSTNFYIHGWFVYSPWSVCLFLLQKNRQTNPGTAYKSLTDTWM